MSNKKILLTGLILFFAIGLSAQTFEEYKKNYQDGLKQMKQERDKRMKEMQEEFDKYVEERDKEFTEYLENNWKQFQLFKGEKPPEKPKPEETPEFEPKPEEREDLPIKKLPVSESKPLPEEEKIVLPLVQKSAPPDYHYLSGHIGFYGNEIDFEYDPQFLKCTLRSPGKEAIAAWWGKASETHYNHLINQLLRVKDNLALNDWAYYLLLKKTSRDIFSSDNNQANLLLWFMLVRSGYDAKIGYWKDQTTILLPSKQTLYRISYLHIDGKDYYMMDYLGELLIHTYSQNYPGSDKIMDYNIYYPMNLSNKKKTRNIDVTYKGTDYNFKLAYNPDMISLFNDYPVAAMNVYFDASMTAQAKDALAENLLPVIQGMSLPDAANFLLYFTQNAFEYEIDEKQFGKERFLFPEETIHYPFSDCEDRSAFYSYLVKEFLKIDIIGLEYPWHIATAIKLNDDIKGDYVSYNGINYIIADPTYINAPVGRAMPRYKNQEAKVIPLNNFRHDAFIADKKWAMASKAGAYRGGLTQNYALDKNGNCYLTGYFTKEANFGTAKLTADSPGRHCFVAKYDKQGNLKWVKNLEGNGISTGISVTSGSGNKLLIMGTYNGNIRAGRTALSSEKEDIFLMKLSADGQTQWLSKAGLDGEETDMFLKYAITFNPNGRHAKTDLFAENPASSSNGVFINDNGNIMVLGSFNNTTGMNVADFAFADQTEFNYADMLKAETDALLDQDVNRTIAGLFATINLVKSSGVVIPGKAAQEALDKYNPGFRKEYSGIYKRIGEINFLKNSEGIIIIQTEDGGSVVFDKVKLYNNARIKISSLPDGNEQLDILSGISVGKFVVWYDLNYVRLFRENGNMLFDYDSDHTQTTVNIKDDILD